MKSDMFQVLAVLAEADHDSSEILDAIRRRGGGAGPSLPTLYRRLKEALDEGWVVSVEADEPPSDTGPGRPRQRFRLSELGRDVAGREASVWATFAAPLVPGETRS